MADQTTVKAPIVTTLKIILVLKYVATLCIGVAIGALICHKPAPKAAPATPPAVTTPAPVDSAAPAAATKK